MSNLRFAAVVIVVMAALIAVFWSLGVLTTPV
jgi:hypothetical protein